MSKQAAPPTDPAPAADWRNHAAKLVDQQLWLLGYDIRRPEGNLLIELGGRRVAAPAESDCPSCYQIDLATGECLTLRGFGLLCESPADAHAVFLHRDAFKVSWLDSLAEGLPWQINDIPANAGVPGHASETAVRLVGRVADWVAGYELAVTERLGVSYREVALEEWGRPVAANPAESPDRWRLIAREVADRPELIAAPTPRKKRRRRRAKPLSLR